MHNEPDAKACGKDPQLVWSLQYWWHTNSSQKRYITIGSRKYSLRGVLGRFEQTENKRESQGMQSNVDQSEFANSFHLLGDIILPKWYSHLKNKGKPAVALVFIVDIVMQESLWCFAKI